MLANNTPFKSKSHETKVLKQIPASLPIKANIQIWPSGASGFGVAVRVNEKGLKAQLCRTKQDIIQFLEREL
jgi:hypothetical protein